MNKKLKKLLIDLHDSDLEYYIEKDSLVVTRIEEIIAYIFKNGTSPDETISFSCDGRNVCEWIKEVAEFQEPLYVDFTHYIKQPFFERNSQGIEIWNFKFQDFYAFVSFYRRLPRVYEKNFFDGTDMYKWYHTQLRRLNTPEKTNCILFTDEQNMCLTQLNALINEINGNNHSISLSNMDKLKELHAFLLEHENLFNLNNYSFSDGTKMDLFVKKIKNKKIVLTEKEQDLFHHLMELVIRIHKDGVKGIVQYQDSSYDVSNLKKRKGAVIQKAHFSKKLKLDKQKFLLNEMSNGSRMAYVREKMQFISEDMGNLLGMGTPPYIKTENNHYKLTVFRKMQFLILIARMKEKDSILEKIRERFSSDLVIEDAINYYLFQLSAMFSFDKKRKLCYQFSKDYRTQRDVLPNINYSTKSKLSIYSQLEKIKAKEILLPDELSTILELEEILKETIFEDKADDQILNKVNLSLGLPFSTISSIYNIDEAIAQKLLEKYEFYKVDKKLNTLQLSLLNRASDLLSCALNPGQDLGFEVLRLKERLGVTITALANMFGLERTRFSHAIYGETSYTMVWEAVESSLSKLDAYGPSKDIERFKSCFLEGRKLNREK